MKDIYNKSVEEGLSRLEVDSIHAHKNSLGQEHINESVRDILKHHTLALIDAEIEREQKAINGDSKPTDDTMELHLAIAFTDGYNKAREERITHLKEQREIISKEK